MPNDSDIILRAPLFAPSANQRFLRDPMNIAALHALEGNVANPNGQSGRVVKLGGTATSPTATHPAADEAGETHMPKAMRKALLKARQKMQDPFHDGIPMPVLFGDAPEGDGHGEGCGCGCCTPRGDSLSQNAGDRVMGNRPLRLKTIHVECGAMLNARIQQSYFMLSPAFRSALQLAEATSRAQTIVQSGIQVGADPLILVLQSTSSVPQSVLGLEVRVSLPETGAAGSFTVQFDCVTQSGLALSSDLILVSPQASGEQTAVYFYPFNDVNRGQYYYAPAVVGVTPSATTAVTVTGLPEGATAVARSMQTDAPNYRFIWSE